MPLQDTAWDLPSSAAFVCAKSCINDTLPPPHRYGDCVEGCFGMIDEVEVLRQYYVRRASEYEQIYCRDDPVRQGEQQSTAAAIRKSKKTARPADFGLQYGWSEGTIPPPDYYEYTIHIGPGPQGQIVFIPDYPMHSPPVWTEQFAADAGALDELYASMVAAGVFRRRWTRRGDHVVGGSLEWLEVTVHGEQFKVPGRPQGTEALAGVYAAIRALVPEAVWSKLMAQREAFMAHYEEEA